MTRNLSALNVILWPARAAGISGRLERCSFLFSAGVPLDLARVLACGAEGNGLQIVGAADGLLEYQSIPQGGWVMPDELDVPFEQMIRGTVWLGKWWPLAAT
jgi:hypothetical protein